MTSHTHAPHAHEPGEESPISITHLVSTLARYRYVILASIAIVMFVYVTLAIAAYLLAPSQEVTSIAFRVEFEGADRGEYPNGAKFSSSEIVSTPILTQVYRANSIKRFGSFSAFKRSIFIQESSRAQAALDREYQGKLSDPKLNAVERARIESEYQLKRDSLRHSEYSINFLRSRDTMRLPPMMVEKVLRDVLSAWALAADQEKGALSYRLPVASRNALHPEIITANEPVIALDILRTRLGLAAYDMGSMMKIPSADVIRVGENRISLADVRVAVGDLDRYRIQPLLLDLIARRKLRDSHEVETFFASQLEYSKRQMSEATMRVDAMREALRTFSGDSPTTTPSSAASTNRPAGAETGIVPQLSETFLDHLVQIVSDSRDVEFRQQMVLQINDATSTSLLPWESGVAFYTTVNDRIKSGSGGALPAQEEAAIQEQLKSIYTEVSRNFENMTELYGAFSKNLNPDNLVYTITGPVSHSAARALGFGSLLTYGILTFFLSLPLILIGVFLHNRMQEEEEEEEAEEAAAAAAE
jgi:hypothetical protein